LEITSVISFFVVVCQTNSTIESFFVGASPTNPLSIVDATHLPQKTAKLSALLTG